MQHLKASLERWSTNKQFLAGLKYFLRDFKDQGISVWGSKLLQILVEIPFNISTAKCNKANSKKEKYIDNPDETVAN